MEKILVKMRATGYTDGNPEDVVTRTFKVTMDPDLIRSSKSLQEAIDRYISQSGFITEIHKFEYFDIDGQRIFNNFWTQD